MPDYRPKGLGEMIRPKCRVVYFPLMAADQMSEYSCRIDVHALDNQRTDEEFKLEPYLDDNFSEKVSCRFALVAGILMVISYEMHLKGQGLKIQEVH